MRRFAAWAAGFGLSPFFSTLPGFGVASIRRSTASRRSALPSVSRSAIAFTMPRNVQVRTYSTSIHALAKRPDLAAQVAIIASTWQHVERRMATIFIALLGGEEEAALAIYSELIDRGLREVAIRAVFRRAPVEGVSPSDLARVFKMVKEVADARNKVVHANWGESDEYPNGLLAFNTKDVNETFYHAAFSEGGKGLRNRTAADLYESQDLAAIIEKMHAVLDAIKPVMGQILLVRLRERFPGTL